MQVRCIPACSAGKLTLHDVCQLHPLCALLTLRLSARSMDELTLHDLHSLLQLVCADCPQRVGKSAFKAAMPLSNQGQLPRLPLEAMWLSLEVTFLYEKVSAAGGRSECRWLHVVPCLGCCQWLIAKIVKCIIRSKVWRPG